MVHLTRPNDWSPTPLCSLKWACSHGHPVLRGKSCYNKNMPRTVSVYKRVSVNHNICHKEAGTNWADFQVPWYHTKGKARHSTPSFPGLKKRSPSGGIISLWFASTLRRRGSARWSPPPTPSSDSHLPMPSHYGHCHVIDIKDIAEDSICFGGKEKEEIISIKLYIFFCFVSFASLSKTNIPLYPR